MEKHGSEFWTWARQRRQELGLSVADLARSSGVDRDTIAKMEANPAASYRSQTRERVERALTPPDLTPGEIRDAIVELGRLHQQLAQVVARSLEVIEARLDSIDGRLPASPPAPDGHRPN